MRDVVGRYEEGVGEPLAADGSAPVLDRRISEVASRSAGSRLWVPLAGVGVLLLVLLAVNGSRSEDRGGEGARDATARRLTEAPRLEPIPELEAGSG